MTSGSILRHIILFALPLMFGNVFQMLYNTVDSIVVGNFVGKQALAAMGATTPIVNMFVFFFNGFSVGAGVVIGNYFGAHDYDKLHDAIETTVAATFALCAIFTAVGIAGVDTMLRIMDTPDDVFSQAALYLRIYIGGISGLLVYNICSGILRAVGDSTRPLYFLILTSVMNIVLDLAFVILLDAGIAGVAYATIIAQGVSAVLVIMSLMRTDSCIKIRVKALKLDMEMLKKIIKVGIPAAIQMAITSFSNIFVQSYINFFGADCMSGWTAYSKIDQLLFLPMQSIALASTTFVGQNLGINKVDRAKKGVSTALIMAAISTVIVMIPVLIFAPHAVAFFNDKSEVVEIGTMLLRWISPFYVLCCVNQVYSGALRGAGNSRAPMLIMLTSFVVFRQIYLFVMANFISNTILPIAMSYPAGWLLCSTLTFIYYHRTSLTKNRLVEDEPKK